MTLDSDGAAQTEHDHSASLARLRLFLAPHAPSSLRSSSAPSATIEHAATTDEHAPEAASECDGVAATAHSELLHASSANNNNNNGNDSVAAMATSADASGDASRSSDGPLNQTTAASASVATVTPLSATSREFARVQYLLQRCVALCGLSVCDNVVMHEMASPSLVAQYAEHAHGLLELDSWVAVNDLGAALDDVHSFDFTSLDARYTRLKFSTGTIALDASATATTPQQLVLCKIAVGRSLVIEHEADAQQPLPPGYSSFYLQPPSPSSSSITNADSDDARSYYHEYILPSPHQVLPMYLVRFHVVAATTTATASMAGPCALCEKHAAVVHCRACEAAICAACDEQVHSANKLVRRHKRTPLRPHKPRDVVTRSTRRRSSNSNSLLSSTTAAAQSESLPGSNSNDEQQQRIEPAIDVDAVVAKQLEVGLADAQTPCRVHTDKRVEFYCCACDAPVCVHCKMLGDHSVGEKGAHRLLTLADAYESSVRDSLKYDPLLESRKRVIQHQLSALAQSKAAVQQNWEDVAAAIRLQCTLALERLDEHVRAKVRVLDGETHEFERQLQQIAWTDDALDALRVASPAITFLAAWHEHRAVRSELRDFPACALGSSAEHVKGDLALVGRLQVVSTEQLSAGIGSGSDATAADTTSSNRMDSVHACAANSRADALSAALAQLTVSSSDVRKRLLNAKPLLATECLAAAAHSTINAEAEAEAGRNTDAIHSASTLLSARGLQTIDAIRNELLATASVSSPSASRTATFTSHAAVSPTVGSAASRWLPPTPTRAKRSDTASTLRGLTLQPAWTIQQQQQRMSVTHASPIAQQRARCVSDAWSTLLRQELALVGAEVNESEYEQQQQQL